jgi:squalene-hopene/tetraprenyl-beta-curcumene cyclase
MFHRARLCVVPLAVLFACSVVAAQSAPQAKSQAAIEKGLEFLKSQQQPDGSWQISQQEPPGISALVLRAIVGGEKYNADTDFVKKGFEKLLSYQSDDGGIYAGAQGNYNTAVAVTALAAAKKPEFKPSIDKALAFLKGSQWTETANSSDGQKIAGEKDAWYGGWGYANRGRGLGRPDLSNSQMVLDALHDAGLKQDDPAFKAAIKFVSRLQNSSETNDQPWATNDGGFIYAPGDDRKGTSMAGDYTSPEGDRHLRSYGSMTYAGLKSFIYAGLTRDDPRVRAAWDWITKNWTLDANPGMGVANPQNAQQGLYYYFHTMARAMDEFDQPVITDPQGKKHDWRIELVEKLVSLQKPDGSWVGDARWMESNPSLVTAYTLMALEEVQKDLKEHPAQP